MKYQKAEFYMDIKEQREVSSSISKSTKVWRYLAGLALGLGISFLEGLLVFTSMHLTSRDAIFLYISTLIVAIILTSIRRTRTFGTGFLTAEIVALCVLGGFIYWLLSSWRFYGVHF